MKSSVAITLIIVGAGMILAPAISDYLLQRNLVELVVEGELTKANLHGEMSGFYRCVCWGTGGLMIALGIGASTRSAKDT